MKVSGLAVATSLMVGGAKGFSFEGAKNHREKLAMVSIEHTYEKRSIFAANDSYDLKAARHSRRIKLSDDAALSCYENARRIYSAVPIEVIPSRLEPVLQHSLTWMRRGDYAKLDAADWKNHHDFVMFVCDLEDEDPAAADEMWDYRDRDFGFSLKLSDASRLTISADLARLFLEMHEDLKLRSLPAHSNHVVLSPDDPLTLWVKKGTSFEQFKQDFSERTGELGKHLIVAFMQAACEYEGFDASEPFMRAGLALNLVEWRQRYVVSVMKSLGIYKMAQQVEQRIGLCHPDFRKVLNIEIQRKLRTLIHKGLLGPECLKTAKLPQLIEMAASSAINYLHYHADLPAPLTITLNKVMPQIASELNRMPDSELKEDLLKMLHNGWVDFKIISPKHRSHFHLARSGVSNQPSLMGLANGAYCTIMSKTWQGLSRGQESDLSPIELSTCIHEMVHARDWLTNPSVVNNYSGDPLILTAMEQRAFYYQNQLQREQQKAGLIESPRFNSSLHIYDHIRRAYLN